MALPVYCSDYRIESGVMALTLSDKIRMFLRATLNWYDGPMLALARKCLVTDKTHKDCTGVNLWRRNNIGLNDIYVLAQALHDFTKEHGLKHGWFANERWTCERMNNGKPFWGQCQPCVNAKPGELVAPFWVDYYIQHRKGGVGLMAVQHDKNRVLEESDKKNRESFWTHR